MSIRFITKRSGKAPVLFGDVEVDQFFINHGGYLCQKIDSGSYNAVATPEGMPHAAYIDDACSDLGIKRILDETTKIEF